jgi:hypothetical protein
MTSFKCEFNRTDGWHDKVNFQISTQNNTNQTWSWVFGKEIDVKPNDQYELLPHMKLNEWAAQSHFVLVGVNETSKEWYEIAHCPSGVNGPEWKEFSCLITFAENTPAISPVLNAGLSSRQGETAVTMFDAIQIFRIS